MQAQAQTNYYTPIPQRSSPILVLGLFIIVLAALAFGGWNYLLDKNAVAVDPLIPESAHVTGSEDAPVKVVVFGDFQCDGCTAFAEEVMPLLQEEFIDPNVVQLAYRHYPVLGDNSVRAALAAECAAQQGKFWEMHELLYSWKAGVGVERFPSELLQNLAIGTRIGPVEYRECMENPDTIIPVEQGLRDGFSLGVRQLPAVYVNGKLVNGTVDYSRLRALIIVAATE
jgi:protein-disulfide isomerase